MKKRQVVFDTYWQTAFKRQEIFFKKINDISPYTVDPIFEQYKFCNVYRASDRVSQFLIKDVIYGFKTTQKDTLFKIFFFRLLNKIETWQALEQKLERVSLTNFTLARYAKALEEIKQTGVPIYGNAFILCANKAFGFDLKHLNHLALLEMVFIKEAIAERIIESKSLKEVFLILKELPLIGDFMAYQIAIDFNYSEVINFSENDFTIAGPGARRGIQKCFLDTDGKDSEYIISYMVENQQKEFKRLNLPFKNLFGREMQAIDCQGWFCETDKYSRVQFPELKSNRSQIKAKYKPINSQIEYFYPPKWGLVIKP